MFIQLGDKIVRCDAVDNASICDNVVQVSFRKKGMDDIFLVYGSNAMAKRELTALCKSLNNEVLKSAI